MKNYRSITVGIADGPGDLEVSNGCLQAARQAHWLAKRTGATLTLLHSTWDEDAEEQTEAPQASAELAASIARLAEELTVNGTPAEIRYSADRPWLALIRRVLKSESDLLFVGKHDSCDRREMGSNTRKLLRKCPSPVWVVDPHTDLVRKCILAATDLSDVGDRVTRMAAELAVESGAELHVLHAWQRSMHFQLESASESDEEVEKRMAAKDAEIAERILEGLGDLRDATNPQLHVGCASSEPAILEGIERLEPDLVVMGSLSRTGVPGLLVGNTAERLVERVPCSLLTIKPEGFVSPVAI